ncbi:MAG: bacteriophage holin [Legionella sp.]|nr:bacteriophage holin [Legionella sp.]
MNGCRMSPVALGLSFGVLWGISILMVGLAATYYAYGHDFVVSMGNLYPGYTPSVRGSLLGAFIAFIDAFIMGFLIGWLYNKFTRCTCTCCNKPAEQKDLTP